MVRHRLVEQVEPALKNVDPAVNYLVGGPIGETAMALFNGGVADIGGSKSCTAQGQNAGEENILHDSLSDADE